MQVTETETAFSSREIEDETERLLRHLMYVDCTLEKKWNLDECHSIAPLTLEINALKRERNAIILAHSYVLPEIIYGVADHVGDSYQLSEQANRSSADIIVFAGVVFMAETAKILSPDATVVVPDIQSGCSLADSLDASEVYRLRALYPEAAVVCYINSTAAEKNRASRCAARSTGSLARRWGCCVAMPTGQLLV